MAHTTSGYYLGLSDHWYLALQPSTMSNKMAVKQSGAAAMTHALDVHHLAPQEHAPQSFINAGAKP